MSPSALRSPNFVPAGGTAQASLESSCSICPSQMQQASPFRTFSLEVSSGDKRQYRGLFLANDLQVILISDPSTDKSAVAMDVGVGYFSDPENVPGLAHFLEHMLFLGTEKYPDEKSFSAFLNAHGGRSNAYTSTENTNFYFDITPDFLEPALDMFAQFFISPLFNIDATLREMQAVDSENSKNLQSDVWRLFQVLKSTCSPTHPFHKFGTGNLETLNEIPKKLGINIRAELLKFHAEKYSSNIMKLAVFGREDLDTLQRWVAEKFSAVKNLQLKKPAWPGRPFCPENHQPTYVELITPQKIFSVVPVKDLRTIDILWWLPGQDPFYRVKPTHYLANLIGHEGPGSILSLLKAKGWASELVAGPGWEASDFSLFKVHIDLTEEGLANRDEIVRIVFQYIELLRSAGVQQWFFDEIRVLDDMKFRFKDKEDPIAYVSMVAQYMHHYPPEHVLTGTYLMYDYDPKLITEQLNLLTAEEVRVFVVSKTFAEIAKEVERWYQTAYRVDPMSPNQLSAWKSPGTNADLFLPPPNIFIPTKFDIKPSPNNQQFPVLIRSTPVSKVWHKTDFTFLKPKANIFIELQIPAAYDSPRAAVLTRLFTKLVEDSLNEYAYAATLAELKYSLMSTVQGIQLNIKGYNDKQLVLLEKILQRFRDLDVKQDRLDLFKDKVLREYKNWRMDQPYNLCIYESSFVMQNVRWHNEQFLSVLENEAITREDVQAFARRIFEKCFCELLVHGNVTPDESIAVSELVESTLGYKALLPLQFVQHRAVRFPKNKILLRALRAFNPEERNSAIEVDYQIGLENVHENALLDLLAQVTNDASFYQLRTVEQLGYIVYSGVRRVLGAQYYRIIVQSSTKDPMYLDARVQAFVASIKEFEAHVAALIARKLEKDKTLTEETNRLWNEIALHRYTFNEHLLEAEHLKSIKLSDLIDFYDKYLAPSAPKRRKLLTQVYGKGATMPTETPAADRGIVVRGSSDQPPI